MTFRSRLNPAATVDDVAAEVTAQDIPGQIAAAVIAADLPGQVATTVASDPTVAAAAASAASSAVGMLTVAKATALQTNRVVNPQVKGGPVDNGSPSLFTVSETTTGLPAGFSYGAKSVRQGTNTTSIAALNLTPVAAANASAVPVVPGEIISVSAKVWSDDPASKTAPINLIFHDSSDSNIGTATGASVALATSTWQTVKLEYVKVPATATHVRIQAQVNTAGTSSTGSATIATGVMLQSGPTVGAYADGTTALWEWTGTAHASKSVQVHRSKADEDAILAQVGAVYTDILTGKNLYNAADSNIATGYLLDDVSGTISAFANYRTSGWIPAVAGTQYTVSAHRVIAFYNSSYVIIGTGTNTGNNATVDTYTAPAGTVFMRVCFKYTDYPTLQVEEGSSSTAYEAYYEYLDLSDRMTAAIANVAFPELSAPPLSVTVSSGANTFAVSSVINGKTLTETISRYTSRNGTVGYGGVTYDGDTITNNDYGDDCCPIRTQNGTLGGDHGYVNGIGVYTNPDGKTNADVGSVWHDTAGNEYVMLGFTAEVTPRLMMGQLYTGSPPTAPTQNPLTNLTHVSGATHTGSISYTTFDATAGNSLSAQLRPTVGHVEVTAWLDGNPLISNGTYQGNVFELRESYIILDYKQLYDYAKAHPGAALNGDTLAAAGCGAVQVQNIFRWEKPGIARITTIYDELQPTTLSICGAVQAGVHALAGQTITRYVPGMGTVSGNNWSNGVDLTSWASTVNLPASAELVSGRVPAFSLDTLSSGGTVLIGFAMGYLPFGSQYDTASKSATRQTRAATALWNMRDSKKCYPAFTTGEAAGWGHIQVDAYRAYLSPDQVAAVLANKADALAAFAALNATAGIE